jgi:hypothetical protein
MPFDIGHALIIGVGAYNNAPQLDVPAASEDAAAVAAALIDPAACAYPPAQVQLLRDADATRESVLTALDIFGERVPSGATALIFFSGHGHRSDDGAYHLMASDTRLTPAGNVASGAGISQGELLGKLRLIAAERVICIFNACHAGAITPVLSAAPAFTGAPLPDTTSAALLATGAGRVIITACREQQVAYVGSGRQTIFASELVAALRGAGVAGRNGYLSAFDLYQQLYAAVGERVARDVPEATRRRYNTMTQEPELTVLKGSGPFAIGLCQGAATLGAFEAPAAPPTTGAVREVDAAASQAAFTQIIRAETVTQVFGDQQVINVAGDYAEGNIDKRQTTIIGGDQYNLGGDFRGATVQIGGRQSAAPPPDPARTRATLMLHLDQLRVLLRSDTSPGAQALDALAAQLAAALAEPTPNVALLRAYAAGMRATSSSAQPAAAALTERIVGLAEGLL